MKGRRIKVGAQRRLGELLDLHRGEVVTIIAPDAQGVTAADIAGPYIVIGPAADRFGHDPRRGFFLPGDWPDYAAEKCEAFLARVNSGSAGLRAIVPVDDDRPRGMNCICYRPGTASVLGRTPDDVARTNTLADDGDAMITAAQLAHVMGAGSIVVVGGSGGDLSKRRAVERVFAEMRDGGRVDVVIEQPAEADSDASDAE